MHDKYLLVEAAGVEGSIVDATIREDHVAPTTTAGALGSLEDPRGQELSHAVLQAVLDGDYARARQLAEELRELVEIGHAGDLRSVR